MIKGLRGLGTLWTYYWVFYNIVDILLNSFIMENVLIMENCNSYDKIKKK